MTERKPKDYRDAPQGEGPLANSWEDKPHRVLYDCVEDLIEAKDRIIELERANRAERMPGEYLRTPENTTRKA